MTCTYKTDFTIRLRVFLQNDLTGEHSCIMLKILKNNKDEDHEEDVEDDDSWLNQYWTGWSTK